MAATIYHNPQCSKSRQTLALLRERGVEPNVVLYLTDPPTADVLTSLLVKLSLSAAAIVRQKEFRALGLESPADDAGWVALMVSEPSIIERPIVVVGDRAVLGRPPENVLNIMT